MADPDTTPDGGIVVPIMPTGSGVADLEMVRELDAIVDGDPAGDEPTEADRLKE